MACCSLKQLVPAGYGDGYIGGGLSKMVTLLTPSRNAFFVCRVVD